MLVQRLICYLKALSSTSFICHSVSWMFAFLFLSRMKGWGVSVPTVSLQGSATSSNLIQPLLLPSNQISRWHPFSLCCDLICPLSYFSEMWQGARWNVFLCFNIWFGRTFSSLACVTFYLVLNCSTQCLPCNISEIQPEAFHFATVNSVLQGCTWPWLFSCWGWQMWLSVQHCPAVFL